MAGKKITLKSSDGELFEVEEVVAGQSQTIKHMIEKNSANIVIPLSSVNGKILAKVIEYRKKHVDAPTPEDDHACANQLKIWDAEFVNVDQSTLFDLTLAAQYLEVKSLIELTCQTAVAIIKGQSSEQIRRTFNIKGDIELTPEKEEQISRENIWAPN